MRTTWLQNLLSQYTFQKLEFTKYTSNTNNPFICEKHLKTMLVKDIGVIILVVLCLNLVSGAAIITTDLQGKETKSFSTGDIAYLKGSHFPSNSNILIQIINPRAEIDPTMAFSDDQGNFMLSYDFPNANGEYYIVASDSSGIVKVLVSSGAIWTTKNDCGSQNQDANQYSPGENVYINGAGFSSGNYSWEIRGKPGGASCDPNQVVASGNKNVNSSGKVCFNAYTIPSSNCGQQLWRISSKI